MEHLPKDIINHILEFDGNIRYKNGEYINTVHPHDARYNMLTPLIKKKKHIIKHTEVDKKDNSFYFEFKFTKEPRLGLCYATGGWSGSAITKKNKLEICYFNFKTHTFLQERTYI